jgi:hypothetical protein
VMKTLKSRVISTLQVASSFNQKLFTNFAVPKGTECQPLARVVNVGPR